MVGSGVVWYEVKQQVNATAVETASETMECGIAAEVGMNCVRGNCKARTADVVIGKAGKQLLKLTAEFRMFQRDLAACRSGLPHTQEPHPIKPVLN